jgi:uncharacterized short protein YbdD (DUF466 family)
MRWREALAQAARTARAMVGVPDYGAYVDHCRSAHPGAPVLSREAFHRRAVERRYGGDPARGGRCC